MWHVSRGLTDASIVHAGRGGAQVGYVERHGMGCAGKACGAAIGAYGAVCDDRLLSCCVPFATLSTLCVQL